MAIEFLLVDDDSDDSDLIFEVLNEIDSSIKYTYAMDGPEALTMLEEGYTPSIIFLDINMPGMNGWQCLSKFKANGRFKNIPVVMYSTSSYQHEIEKAFELGALAFFTKPNHYSLLKKNIKVVLDALSTGQLQSIDKTVLESITPSEKKP
jgi:CheY-like chemotaxis protein